MKKINRYSELSDDDLLQAYSLNKSNDLLGVLLQRYTALLFGVALKYLKNRVLAEDAVQQVFLKVLTHFPDEGISNFKGWLYVLMRNTCLQQLRDKSHTMDDSVLAHVAEVESDQEEIKWHEYTLQQMSEAVALLSKEQNEVIVLFYFKKCSYEQIIEQTGFTFLQVKSYVQNGKRNLRILLLKKLEKRK